MSDCSAKEFLQECLRATNSTGRNLNMGSEPLEAVRQHEHEGKSLVRTEAKLSPISFQIWLLTVVGNLFCIMWWSCNINVLLLSSKPTCSLFLTSGKNLISVFGGGPRRSVTHMEGVFTKHAPECAWLRRGTYPPSAFLLFYLLYNLFYSVALSVFQSLALYKMHNTNTS